MVAAMEKNLSLSPLPLAGGDGEGAAKPIYPAPPSRLKPLPQSDGPRFFGLTALCLYERDQTCLLVGEYTLEDAQHIAAHGHTDLRVTESGFA